MSSKLTDKELGSLVEYFELLIKIESSQADDNDEK